jgi:hypothetical protein
MKEKSSSRELEELKIAAVECFAHQKFESLMRILNSMIDLGSPWAMHYLGGCYTYGHGVEENLKFANQLYLEAAGLNFPDSQMAIGNNLLIGHGIEKDVEKGIYFLKLASDQGNGYASFLLGKWNINAAKQAVAGYTDAVVYFRKGANQGEHRAMQSLAWLLANGVGIEKNEKEALSLNARAAELGNETAAYNAAGALRYGLGTDADIASAIRYYEIAANIGMIEAMHNLGTIFFNAEGVEQDVEKASHWYLKAANFGSGLSSLCLGLMSEQGTNGAIDMAFAFAWYSVAVAQECEEANQRLIAISQKIGKEDLDKAVFILTSMSDRGFSWAQQALGCLYLSGKIITRDDQLAFKWLNAAAGQGLATAKAMMARTH